MANNRKHRIIFGFFFFIYIVVMIYFLFLSDDRFILDTYRYNLEPFKEIKRFITYRKQVGIYSFIINIVGNVVAFIPFGYLIPKVTKKEMSFLKSFACCFMFTLIIESVQLFTRLGRFDVDDIIMNTVGGVTGYILHRIYMKRRHKNAVKS